MEQRIQPASSAPEPVVGPRNVDRSERELSCLAELAHALATAQDTKEVLHLVVDRLQMLQGAQAAVALGLTPDADEFVVEAARPSTLAVRIADRRFEREGAWVDRALREARPVPVHPAGPAARDPMILMLLDGNAVESGLAVPIRGARGVELGVLLALNPASRPTPADVRFLLSLADHAAVALQRIRLDQRSSTDATRMRVMSAVLTAIAAGHDEEEVLQAAVRPLLEGLGVDAVEVAMRDGGELVLRYRYPENGDGYGLGAARTRTLHLRTTERGRPTTVRPGDGRWDAREPGLACFPLRTRDRTLGSLLVARRSREFDEPERRMLEATGRHLAMALEICRLFRRAAVEADELERLAAERSTALQATQEKLERSQWLASLGEIAAGVAHDLNNALNPIVAFAELIKEHSDQPARVRTYADRILMAAQGGAETVRRIQRFTRHRTGAMTFQPISVASLVQDAVELVLPTLADRGHDIRIEQSVDQDLCVNGSAGELRQALLNLISNAIDAMPAGGTLRFVARGSADRVLISVQDTGTGMPPSILERAMEPFFTTKGAHGTGLGLAEVFGIVRRHGGTLEIETWPGVGTTVTMSLPRTSTLPESTSDRGAGRSPARRGFRILLIDDNRLGLEATAASLRSAGHSVATAPTAKSALAHFKAGEYDVILTDLGLPDMEGWDLIQEIRSRDPNVRIGVITGWEIGDDQEDLNRRGVEMVLTKPVDPDQLLSLL